MLKNIYNFSLKNNPAYEGRQVFTLLCAKEEKGSKMSKLSAFFALAVLFTGLNVSAGDSAPNSSDFRQTYRLDAEKTKVNAARMVQDLKKIPETWKEKPAFYYVIPPFSDVPRLPDAYPDDGVPAGTVRLIASLGEFEAGSVLIAPQKNVDRFTLVSSDLKDAQGNVIPASSVDIKMVKNWYQAGSGWYGYFADALGRKLTPELLLNDENMVRVVPETKDNYVRYSNEDGSSFWQWMSANFVVVNYSFDNQANQGLIADAPTLQPVVLNKNEFKQYMITVHVPANAAGGLYQGNIALVADGQNIGNVPVSLKVLPFALPNPKSNYDMNKGYYLCLYG